MQKKGLERLELCAQRRHLALSRRQTPPPLRRRSAELGPVGIGLLSESGLTVGARAARLHHAARATYRTASRWRPWAPLCSGLSVSGRDSADTQWTLGVQSAETAPSAGSPPSFPGRRRSVRSGMSLLVPGAPTNGAAGPPSRAPAASSAVHGRQSLTSARTCRAGRVFLPQSLMPALRAPLQAAHSFRWRYLWISPAPVHSSSSITREVASLPALTILSASHFV